MNEGIGYGIDSPVALNLGVYDTFIFQHREMLRNYGLRLIEAMPEIGHAGIPLFDEAEYFQTDGVAADLQFLRICVDQFFGTTGFLVHI